MKRVLYVLAIVALVASAAAAQSVVGSLHDLSSSGPNTVTNVGRVCVFCHTPHQATTASGQDPLWNHTLSATASYGVYASTSLDASPTDVGTFTAGSAAVSNLCLSCHDGTVSVASMYNPPNEVASITVAGGGNVTATTGLITGNPNLGTDLSDDHPVNFTYDTVLATTDGELYDPATTPAVLALLEGGTVQCSSCHTPHSNTFPPFLEVNNTNSALCTTCHIK